MKSWYLRRRLWWPLISLAVLVALGAHAVNSATRARVVIYNEGPASLTEVGLRWDMAAAGWPELGAEDNRQVWLEKSPEVEGTAGGRLWVTWTGGDGRPGSETTELEAGERLVVRLRSDVGVVAVTRSRAWSRRLVDSAGEMLE